MGGRFSYFILLAGMRTGSNYLEATLNEYPGLKCHGELFNPHFIGGRNESRKFGMSLKERAQNPLALLGAMRASGEGLHGFRFFRDHDPRILEHCLNDQACAKIILTRNPLESYVSREIARKTDQWRLSDMTHAKSARIRFDSAAFAEHLEATMAFAARLRHALQTSGQTAFHISYNELGDADVIAGLVRFLGVESERKRPSVRTKKQNPQPLEEKVENFAQMQEAVAGLDPLALAEMAQFEPGRGARIPHYVAAARSPLLFMPLRSGPTRSVMHWLADLDGVEETALVRGFTQKSLRQWKRRAGPHESFSVLRHPVARLHQCFTRHFLTPGDGQYARVAQTLRESYDVPLPEGADPAFRTVPAHREAFLAFARFVKGNLAGQTSVRVDGAWASQAALLAGMADFGCPGHVFHENRLQQGLDYLARLTGGTAPRLTPEKDDMLTRIYDEEVETAVRAAYQRDYMMFGFVPWAAYDRS